MEIEENLEVGAKEGVVRVVENMVRVGFGGEAETGAGAGAGIGTGTGTTGAGVGTDIFFQVDSLVVRFT